MAGDVMKWASPDDWGGIDLTGHCRVWVQDQNAAQRRMTNRSKVWIIEAAGLNHLEGRTPRMLFCQAFDATTVEACNSNPLLSARWIDNKVNSRDRTVRVLALPRDSDVYTVTGQHADIYTNAAAASNALFTERTPTPTFPSDVVYRTFAVAKGGASNALFTEAISASNGLPLVDVCCQEDYVNTLDTALNHDFVYAYSATPGAKIVTGLLEDLRLKFHRLRMNQNRLAFCFLGLAVSNAYGVLASTGSRGFTTTSATYVNMLDQTVTARTGTSPGVMVPGFASGIGQSDSSGIVIYVLAKKSAAGVDGMFKVIGPDHVANNWVETVVSATTATWHILGGEATVNLNAASAEATDVTTARNKFDFHFLAGAASEIYVYSILGFTLQT